MYKTFVIILMFLLYSFLGWVMESIYCFIIDKKFVNRGFLIGPVCPIYGFGSLLIVLFLDRYSKDPLIVFCMAVVICSILEYFTGFLLEKIFKTRWWDYSEKKFNLNGRISLDTMIGFGVLALIMIYAINPIVKDTIGKIDPILLKVITSIFFLLFVIDTFISANIIYKIKGVGKSMVKDQTEEISAKVKEILMSKGIFTRRVINAFPNFKIRNKITKK